MSEWKVPGYTELKPLGSGGFGSVMLARHDATGTAVAVKYLLPELRHDPDFAAMFRGEAEALGALDDPHVVRLYEYVESAAGAAIVMELIDGVTLWDILPQHGRTTPESALVVLYGSLLGLAAAHARGVVHRDFKPRNVLVNAYGASKLTDFGIAARAGTPTVPSGSVAYAPPEQFDGGPASAASDVYAATATFYGPDWERRGRWYLGEAAVVLAALWPSAGVPALHASSMEQVHLSHGAQHAHGPQAAHHPATRAELHRWHLRHILHRDHLRAGRARTASRAAGHLRTATAAVTTAAVVAAIATVAYTSRAPSGPGTPAHPAVAAYPAPLTPPATILAALTGTTSPAGDTYVLYEPGVPSVAYLSGEIKDAATGEVVRLYAQQFPYKSPPAPVGSVTLNLVGGVAAYSFTVTPALATRYQVRLLRSVTAATPLATSGIRTVYVTDSDSYYVDPKSNPNSDPVNMGVCPFGQPICTATYPITVHAPPSALQTEMSQRKYLYRELDGTTSMRLDTNVTFSAPQRVADNEYEIIASFSPGSNIGPVFGFCTTQTEAADGIGLPGPSDCGSATVPASASYLWGGAYA